MNRWRATTIAAVVAAGATGVVVRSAPRQVPQPPIFRSGASVVEVDVSVQDKSGQFIDELTAADFELQEEGRPQAIELFYLVGAGRSGTPSPDPVTSPGIAATARPPHHTFVVVFDDEHLSPGGFKRVQTAAELLFSKHLHPGDVGGVVADGTMVNGRLTTEQDELVAAVRAAKPHSTASSRILDERQWPRLTEVEAVRIHVNNDRPVLNEVVRRACSDDPTMCRGRNNDPTPEILSKASALATNVQAAANATLQRIAAVLNGLARIDGPKTVLLLSEGFVAVEAWPGVEQNIGLAARANARIYTLDARSLDRGQSERLSGADPGGSDAGARLFAQLDLGSDSGNSLAVDTGGFVVRNTNVFAQAIERIVADAANYYVLGYRPDKAPDSKFRRIAVTVKRPGAIVRARRGYVATPPAFVDAAASKPAPVAEGSASRPAERKEEIAITSTAADPAASMTGTVVAAPTTTTAAPRLRPDSLKHTEDLVRAAATPDAAATAGWEAYQRGDLETARTNLAAAAASPDARPWVHYALGQSQYALRDYTGAIASWEHVRAAAPEFEPVYFDLVDGYLQTRDYDKGIRLLRAASGRWPGDHDVFSALGVVQVSRGVLDDAVKSFEKAIALAPAEATGYFNLAKTLELRYRKSRRFVQQIGTWMSNNTDRDNAIANYKRYLAIGGPLENSAREGLARLGWK